MSATFKKLIQYYYQKGPYNMRELINMPVCLTNKTQVGKSWQTHTWQNDLNNKSIIKIAANSFPLNHLINGLIKTCSCIVYSHMLVSMFDWRLIVNILTLIGIGYNIRHNTVKTYICLHFILHERNTQQWTNGHFIVDFVERVHCAPQQVRICIARTPSSSASPLPSSFHFPFPPLAWR